MGTDVWIGADVAIVPPPDLDAFTDQPFHPDRAHDSGCRVMLYRKPVGSDDVVIAAVPTDGWVGTADRLVEEVQEVVDAVVAAGHTCDGVISCEGPAESEIWRIRIRDGRAERQDVFQVWPTDYGLPNDWRVLDSVLERAGAAWLDAQ